MEFEYERHGTLAYFGAYDVHRAPADRPDRAQHRDRAVHRAGRSGDDHRAVRLGRAGVLDRRQRLQSTPGKASIARMGEAWPTATLVHLPVHASWLNQIEIVFSVIQRKVIKPADFADLDALAAPADRLRAPLQRHRRTVRLALHPRRPRRPVRRIDAHRARRARQRSPPDAGGQRSAADDHAPPGIDQDQPRANGSPTTPAHRWPAAGPGRRPLPGQLRLHRRRTCPTARSCRCAGCATAARQHLGLRHLPRQPRRLPRLVPAQRPTAGSPEEALDCACGLYLDEPTAWTAITDTPTN